MSALNRLACRLRDHSWEQHSDPAGTITFCSRCNKLRHVPGSRDANTSNLQGPAGGGEGPYGGGD